MNEALLIRGRDGVCRRVDRDFDVGSETKMIGSLYFRRRQV
jgi:hypothetical protein